MSKFLYRWGRRAAQHPWRMIGVWLIVAATVFGLNATIGGDLSDDFSVPGTEAQRGVDVLDQLVVLAVDRFLERRRRSVSHRLFQADLRRF